MPVSYTHLLQDYIGLNGAKVHAVDTDWRDVVYRTALMQNYSCLLYTSLVYLGNKSILDCLDGVVRPLVILVQPELFLSDSGRYT